MSGLFLLLISTTDHQYKGLETLSLLHSSNFMLEIENKNGKRKKIFIENNHNNNFFVECFGSCFGFGIKKSSQKKEIYFSVEILDKSWEYF